MQTKLTTQIIKSILKPRKRNANKGDFGHALIIAGSKGKMGAAVLSMKACLRSGVGLLTAHVPKCGIDILQVSIPEAMVFGDTNENHISSVIDLKHFQVIGIGPGIGTKSKTQKALQTLLKETKLPIVLDADALNCLSLNKEWYNLIPHNAILTPHSKEFERLVGTWKNEKEKIAKQMEFSRSYNCIIVLKGHRTTISTPDDKLFINSTGNPGMAKGGSGDVLTGMITAFLAQGYSASQSAILGVYIHGLAGDFASNEKSEYAVLASDLIEFIPQAFKKILA